MGKTPTRENETSFRKKHFQSYCKKYKAFYVKKGLCVVCSYYLIKRKRTFMNDRTFVDTLKGHFEGRNNLSKTVVPEILKIFPGKEFPQEYWLEIM